MAIRVICKNCGSKIDAKDELLGQRRNCPKCRSLLLIEPENSATQEIAKYSEDNEIAVPQNNNQTKIVIPQADEKTPIVYDNLAPLPTHNPPTKLLSENRYFILSHERLFAFWEISKGWQINIGTGFVSAKFNKEHLPNTGTYKFVEMIIKQLDTGKQLAGLRTFAVSGKWAIPAIGREPEEILAKLSGKAVLTKPQRMHLLGYIRQNYMPDFLKNAKEVYEYLICDFTSESDVFVANDEKPINPIGSSNADIEPEA